LGVFKQTDQSGKKIPSSELSGLVSDVRASFAFRKQLETARELKKEAVELADNGKKAGAAEKFFQAGSSFLEASDYAESKEGLATCFDICSEAVDCFERAESNGYAKLRLKTLLSKARGKKSKAAELMRSYA